MLEFITTIAINLAVGSVILIAGKKLAKPESLVTSKVVWLKDESADQSHYSGIATALYELTHSRELPDRLLVITCTHPYLTVGHLHKLLKTHDSGDWDIVLSEYGKLQYLPAVIGKKVFSEFHLDNKGRVLAQICESAKYKCKAMMLPNGTIDIDNREEYLSRLSG